MQGDHHRTAGYSLGGGSSAGGGVTPLSADEVRRRRLAALDGGGGGQQQQRRRPSPVVGAAPPAAAAAVTVATVNEHRNNEENDTDLQAALALSTQQQQQQQPQEEVPPINPPLLPSITTVPVAAAATAPAVTSRLPPSLALGDEEDRKERMMMQKIYHARQPFDVLSFHRIMWDDQITTESDKSRWVSQGIDVRRDITTDDSMMMTDHDATTTTTTATTTRDTTTTTTMLDVLSATHLPWGLVQHHGGPCGVLAAIQAEMLRMLVFDNNTEDIPESPDMLVAPTATRTQDLLTGDKVVTTALARSIALILARATLTPSAVDANNNRQVHNNNCVQIVLPNHHHNNTNNTDETSLTWQDLEPWHPTATTASNKNSSTALTVFSIPISESDDDDDDDDNNNNNNSPHDGSSATAKRQKTQESGGCNDYSLTSRIHRLSRIVEAFLLDTSTSSSRGGGGGGVPPLDYFRRHGGVLLLVMSLTASRSNNILQEEFDDPAGTRLTAQFGHCGQELINLLLTGQAVSNVFDNTLKPSGEMVCRGIQHRPAIGYLSQLEAMRYCGVGGYYKSPLFPIWVVGSTSHFTVLFGDPASLKESKSDMLLDECRRAFKAVEGGEENGFIATEQLGTVLQTLKIDVGGATQEDTASRIQTLAASLQVSGAGIILWDDFWKAASRLLTGASLESVLQGGDGSASSNPINVDIDDEPPPLITNFPANPDMHLKPAAAVPAASAVATAPVNHIETDEEMARRLAAEWDDSGVGMSALSNVASAATPMEVETTLMSDEEMARKLQQEWNNESLGAGDSSVAAVNGSPVPTSSDMDDIPPLLDPDGKLVNTIEEEEEDSKPASKPTAKDNEHAFEQFGDSFSLYHYNGLRGGVLTPFRITRLSAEEAVGASIALNRGAGGSSHGAGGSQDLEDVVRTKWPSCAINWLGKQPPYID